MNAQPGDPVLAIWDQGHVLGYYTGLPMVVDGYFEFAHELEARSESSRQALASSDCVTVSNSIGRFDAKYFYLSHGEVDSSTADYGIKQLGNCPSVSLVYASDQARVYEYSK